MPVHKIEKERIPTKTSTTELLKKQYSFFKSIKVYEEVINSIPQFAAIINKNREIIFANNNVLKLTDLKEPSEIIGRLPGDVFKCVNIQDENKSCGENENCKYCGAVQAIVESLENKEKVENECRIVACENNRTVNYDFLISANPIFIENEIFIIVSLTDISISKRKEALERIFFHDVLNTLNGMNGYISILKKVVKESEVKNIIDDIDILSESLLDEINAQRDLLSAERGDLKVEMKILDAVSLVDYCVNHVKHIGAADSRNIEIAQIPEDAEIFTDENILKRIIINLLKNSLEAIETGDKVQIRIERRDRSIIFKVHNNTFIPEDVQTQIFQRSFSTKGSNRGLGTYSIKLLTENYLNGLVGFYSSKKDGTEFYVEIPLD